MTAATRPLYAIDAGGSATSVAASHGRRWTGPSVNPSSVGADTSARHLRALFADISSHLCDVGDVRHAAAAARPAVWFASASLDPRSPGREVARITKVARAAGLCGELVVSNDVTPLVLATPAGLGHVVAVCGTGSGFVASDGRRPPTPIGGCEYLASDEGSAFDLGLRGLRAALRGLDGRAPSTILTKRLAAGAESSVPDLARSLAAGPFPKASVAALAPIVLQAWLDGDAPAGEVVRSAVDELVLGVRVARDARALPPGWSLSVTGGVMTGCVAFYDEFVARAGAPLGAGSATLVPDPAAAILRTLSRLDAPRGIELPDGWLGGHAWHVALGDEAHGDAG